jgi:hypothetical protein
VWSLHSYLVIKNNKSNALCLEEGGKVDQTMYKYVSKHKNDKQINSLLYAKKKDCFVMCKDSKTFKF